jgi:hypothetical protein
MPVLSTLRTPLRDLDVNIRCRGPKLTPYERGCIIGARVTGMSPREITLEILRSNRNSLPRRGRPIVYNKQDRRTML